jgi:hypothetical protein
MSDTVRVIKSRPLYDGGLRIVERQGDHIWGPYILFCVSGILNECSDESAIITLNGNYSNWYVLPDIAAVTQNPLTKVISFITKDNVELTLREAEDDIELMRDLGYDESGMPISEDEDPTNG